MGFWLVLVGLAALAGLVDMETGYRGFLVTGKDEFLEPYNNGIEVYQEKLRALQEKTADNPTQVERWKDLEQRAVAWQREVTEYGHCGAPLLRARLLPKN